MIDTSAVSAASDAATAAGSTTPSDPAGTTVTPAVRHQFRQRLPHRFVLEAARDNVTRRTGPGGRESLRARSFASVAPEVKTISRAVAPIIRATSSRAASTKTAAAQP